MNEREKRVNGPKAEASNILIRDQMNQLQLTICKNYMMKHRYNLAVAQGDKRVKDKRSGSLYLGK